MAEATIADIQAKANTDYGEGTFFKATGLKRDPPRLPFGIFAMDYATGGGVPLYGTTCLWGKDAGGKSNVCLNAVKMAQKICWKCFRVAKFCVCSQKTLRMKAVYEDIEGTLDRSWAQSIGANPDGYHVVLADYGEQYVDIADSILRADDCGLLVVDSLAALAPEAEMEKSASDDFYALQARMIGRMVRKLKQQIIRQRKRGHPCCIIFTNQMRMMMNVMFGSPETMPGGWGMKHEFSLLLRMVQITLKDSDKKFKDAKKQKASKYSFAIRKEKVLTLSGVGEYIRANMDLPEYGLKMGGIADYQTVMTYAKEYGIVAKTGKRDKPWRFLKYNARTLDQIKEVWAANEDVYLHTQMEIIREAKFRLRGK